MEFGRRLGNIETQAPKLYTDNVMGLELGISGWVLLLNYHYQSRSITRDHCGVLGQPAGTPTLQGVTPLSSVSTPSLALISVMGTDACTINRKRAAVESCDSMDINLS